MEVDLTAPAGARWRLLPPEIAEVRELVAIYKRDLGLPASLICEGARPLVGPEYWQEMEGIAYQAEIPFEDVVVANLYYDVLKVVLTGCTAFAVDSESGPLHARNLDWWTENDALRRCTVTIDFTGSRAGVFTTVGWPAFVGVFSAVAPGRFAISLNAVISDEQPPSGAQPVVFVLRDVLERAADFAEALRILEARPLASDSLLLLTGVRKGEIAVIERTPARAEVRFAKDGAVFVTNDYREMQTGLSLPESELQRTACRRFDRISTLVTARRPQSPADCLAYLSDPEVRMGITVQQMVFQAATGRCLVQ